MEKLLCSDIDNLVCCDTISNKLSRISVASMIAKSIRKG